MWFIVCSGLLFGDGYPMPLCCHTAAYGERLGEVDGWRWGGYSRWRKGCVCVYRGVKLSWGRRAKESRDEQRREIGTAPSTTLCPPPNSISTYRLLAPSASFH